ncbi:MAG: hypothetical protein AAF944_26440 [Bacteroidota bacterium]
MKTVKQLTILVMTALSLTFTACEEDAEILGRRDKIATIRPQNPGNITDQPGGLPYPNIIENTYISDIAMFDHTRCRAYRIEWPEYANDVDVDWIPSLFSADGGSLNSINYMNSIHPSNKAKLDLSLYYDNMLKTPYYVSEIWPWNEDYTAETTRFIKYDLSLDNLHDWVTQRPSLFESYYNYQKGVKSEEVSYQQGDFFLMWLTNDNLYGGVRIVSETPRIIEVYIAEPNI